MGLDSIFARLMDFSEKGFRASYRACGELVMEKRRGVLYFPIGFSNSKVGEILTDPAEKAIMGQFFIILSSEAPLANSTDPCNRCNVYFADLLPYLTEEEETGSIVLFVEDRMIPACSFRKSEKRRLTSPWWQ